MHIIYSFMTYGELTQKILFREDIDLSVAKAAKLAVLNVMFTLTEKWRNIFPNEKT